MAKEKSIRERLWNVRSIAWPVLKAQRRALFSCLIFSLALTGLELLRPQPIRLLFDTLLIPNPDHLPALVAKTNIINWHWSKVLAVIAMLILSIGIGLSFTNYFLEVKMAYIGNKVVSRLRKVVFRHLIALPSIFYDSQKTGDVVVRITGDILMMRDLLVTFLLKTANRVMLIVGMIIVMFFMNPLLTLIVLLFLPFLFWTTWQTTLRVGKLTRRQRQNESDVAHSVHEIIGEMRTFAVYGRHDIEDERFDKTNRSSFKNDVKSRRARARLAGITEITLAVGIVIIITMGTREIMNDRMSAGELLVFMSYLRTMFKPIRSLTALVGRTGKAAACAERVLEIIETPITIQNCPDAKVAPQFEGRIEWNDITLSYGGRSKALDGINLKIEAGETIGITGPSGSGKSSLCMLIPRIYDPDSGEVKIDGVNVREYTLESLRSQISFVLQDPGIFDMSIADNISFGLIECPQKDIEQACRDAELFEHITSLPKGLDTLVGQRGLMISGGQRQRLALARAIVRKPHILILDEPFEGLDVPTAQAIQKTILRISHECTILIISHYAEHLDGCDRIIRIEDGKLCSDNRSPHSSTFSN